LFTSSASVTSNLHKAPLPSPISAVINHETHLQAPVLDRHGGGAEEREAGRSKRGG